jgi:hypothetical protein
VTLGLLALLIACGAWTAMHFEFSPLGERAHYRRSARARRRRPERGVRHGRHAARRPLGCYGYARPTSPFIDSLAREGTRCATHRPRPRGRSPRPARS